MKKLFILIAAAIFVAGSVLPALAQDKAEWGFYGSARMWTAWEMKDKKTVAAAGLLGTPGLAGFDDDDLNWDIQSNSRIGANVKFGNVGGRFEYGTGINLRLLYGTWNFGPGTLLVGQDYTPLFFPVSDQCGYGGGDCGLIFWGTVYSGRIPQLKLRMGGFQFALLTPNRVQKLTAGDFPLGRDTDTTLPEVEASYTFNLGPAALMLGGAYKTYDVRGVTAAALEKDYSVDSWLLNAAGRMNFGPFYVNFSLAYAKNMGDYGFTGDIASSLKSAEYVAATDSIEDAKNLLAALVLGFRLSDAVKLEGGFGYLVGEKDFGGVEEKNTVMTYYVQMTWSPAKNVFIVPEFGVIDYGDYKETGLADVDLGKTTYLGVKWQINF